MYYLSFKHTFEALISSVHSMISYILGMLVKSKMFNIERPKNLCLNWQFMLI